RYLNSTNPYLDSTSPTVCMRSATIIVHWLEILLDKCENFFALAVSGSFAIRPAMRVFSWHAKYDVTRIETENGYQIIKSSNCKKAEEMDLRLRAIEPRISKISQGYDRGRVQEDNHGECSLTEWLGIPTHPRNRIKDAVMKAREWEVFVADDDSSLRKKYGWIARKQSGGFWGPTRRSSNFKGIRSYSHSQHDFLILKEPDDLNFTFKTDKDIQFSAFQQQTQPPKKIFPKVEPDDLNESEQISQSREQPFNSFLDYY
ncbi:10910_t:CDS:1, partial [Acaulospora morrowiae]